MAWTFDPYAKPVGKNPLEQLTDMIAGVWDKLVQGGMDTVTGIASAISDQTGIEIKPEEVQQIAAQSANAEDMVDRIIKIKQAPKDEGGPVLGMMAEKARAPILGPSGTPWAEDNRMREQEKKKKRGSADWWR